MATGLRLQQCEAGSGRTTSDEERSGRRPVRETCSAHVEYSPAGRLIVSRSPTSPHHSNEEMTVSGQSVLTDGLNLAKLSNMTHLMHYPISAGFLFRFCEAQYCSENMRFIMEVDRYRDLFRIDNGDEKKKKPDEAPAPVSRSYKECTGFTLLDWKAMDVRLQQQLVDLDGSDADTRQLLDRAVEWYKSHRAHRSREPQAPATAGAGAAAGARAAHKGLSVGSVNLRGLASAENTLLSTPTCSTDSAVVELPPAAAVEAAPADGLLLSAEFWPSQAIDRALVEERIAFIWERFLRDDAEHQICVPASVMRSTLKRIRLAHHYGREVFQEALLDPIKTVHRDIGPRFVTSAEMRELRQRVEDLFETPCAASLRYPQHFFLCDDWAGDSNKNCNEPQLVSLQLSSPSP